MKKETVRQLVNALWQDLSTLSTDNPSFYANVYARKYNNILRELKTLYINESFIQHQNELGEVKADSLERARLMREVMVSVSQLKAFLDAEGD